jgi:hypothetical protein
MGTIQIKPTTTRVTYQGRFENFAFEALTQLFPFYENLIKHLGKYGLGLNNLQADLNVLSEANVNCSLLDLWAQVRISLESLEINFFRLHEVGTETANQILLDSWAAVHETVDSVAITEHVLIVNIDAQIQGASYNDVIRRYVTTPQELGVKAYAGVVFYLPENLANGERQGNIIIDRLAGQDQGLGLKVTAAFNNQQVPINTLSQRFSDYMTRNLESLSLALDQGNGE